MRKAWMEWICKEFSVDFSWIPDLSVREIAVGL